MKFLLDTHVLIWFIIGDTRLPVSLRTVIETVENQRLVSVASLWEIAIKTSLGKLDMGEPFAQLIPGQLIANVRGSAYLCRSSISSCPVALPPS